MIYYFFKHILRWILIQAWRNDLSPILRHKDYFVIWWKNLVAFLRALFPIYFTSDKQWLSKSLSNQLKLNFLYLLPVLAMSIKATQNKSFFFNPIESFSGVQGSPDGASGKEPTCQCRRFKRWGFNPWVGKIPWRRAWKDIPVFLPGESHGQRSWTGYSP